MLPYVIQWKQPCFHKWFCQIIYAKTIYVVTGAFLFSELPVRTIDKDMTLNSPPHKNLYTTTYIKTYLMIVQLPCCHANRW